VGGGGVLVPANGAGARKEHHAMVWNRRLWMRLGAVSALASLVMALMAFKLDDPAAQALVRLGAGFQFAHALATFACAAFMAVGARGARHAAAPFLLGSLVFGGSLYARAAGVWNGGDLALGIGAALMAAGWGVLFVAGWEIDR
jgi:uncharacterized membrane protein YgdD (TMEM256/DUF423 family)